MYPMWPFYPLMQSPMLKLWTKNPVPPSIYEILNSYVNFGKSEEEIAKIKDLPKLGRELIFDFDYPLSNVVDKEYFETQILKHYLRRRIGTETVTAFKIALDAKLNEIMPKYNIIFKAVDGWQLFNDGERVTRDVTDNRTSNTTGTSNNSTESNGTSGNTSDRRFSDTPSNSIADIQAGEYVSQYNYDQDNGTLHNLTESDGETTSNTTDNGTTHEVTSRTLADKTAALERFININGNVLSMIYKELDVLFYQLGE